MVGAWPGPSAHLAGSATDLPAPPITIKRAESRSPQQVHDPLHLLRTEAGDQGLHGLHGFEQVGLAGRRSGLRRRGQVALDGLAGGGLPRW